METVPTILFCLGIFYILAGLDLFNDSMHFSGWNVSETWYFLITTLTGIALLIIVALQADDPLRHFYSIGFSIASIPFVCLMSWIVEFTYRENAWEKEDSSVSRYEDRKV